MGYSFKEVNYYSVGALNKMSVDSLVKLHMRYGMCFAIHDAHIKSYFSAY